MPKKTALEVLEGARKIIATPNKWLKGKFANDEGRYCLQGACRISAFGNCDIPIKTHVEDIYSVPLADCIRELYPERPGRYLPDFNDHKHTTHKDVMAVIDCAINKVKQRKRKKA